MTKNVMIPLVCLTMLVLVAAGCHKGRSARPTGTVSGTVSRAGTPLKLGEINYIDSATGTGFSATIDSSGLYTIAEPVPVAKYNVAISAPTVAPDEKVTSEIKRFPVAKKYANATTSGLTAEVKEGENKIDFNLKK